MTMLKLHGPTTLALFVLTATLVTLDPANAAADPGASTAPSASRAPSASTVQATPTTKAYEHPLDKGPVSIGSGLGLAAYQDWGGSLYGDRTLGVGGIVAHADAVWGVDEATFWRGKLQYASTLCIDHQSGTCPKYTEISVTRGHTLRHRWGHISGEYGLSAGWIDPDHARPEVHDLDLVPVVGPTASAEAYFTPIPFVGVGVEVPVTLNHRLFGGSVMLSVKVGKLAPY